MNYPFRLCLLCVYFVLFTTRISNSIESGDEWIVEEFYFGQMNFEKWRHRGHEIQILDYLGFSLSPTDSKSQLSTKVQDSMAEFLASHVDCEFVVADSYALHNSDRRQPPQLWLQGWIDGSWESFSSGKEQSM